MRSDVIDYIGVIPKLLMSTNLCKNLTREIREVTNLAFNLFQFSFLDQTRMFSLESFSDCLWIEFRILQFLVKSLLSNLKKIVEIHPKYVRPLFFSVRKVLSDLNLKLAFQETPKIFENTVLNFSNSEN